MRAYNYHTVDVFTSERFGGNPLAVVMDADGLTAVQMQDIAAEFGHSETAFVRRPDRADLDAALRIFTPTREIPFAGHPNVGTAFVLSQPDVGWDKPLADRNRFLFGEGVGTVPVTVHWGMDDSGDGCVHGAHLQAAVPYTSPGTVGTGAAAAALGLEPEQLVTNVHGPTVGSCGVPFLLVRANSRASVRGAVPDAAALARIESRTGALGVLVYSPGRDLPGMQEVHARVFVPGSGVPEDPATGSAAAALVGLLVDSTAEAERPWRWRVHQGEDMGRPSIITCSATLADDGIYAAVGGECRMVTSGTIRV